MLTVGLLPVFGSWSHVLIAECHLALEKMYSFAQMCLERKSLFVPDSHLRQWPQREFRTRCAARTRLCECRPGGGGGFQSSGVPTKQRPPRGWGLGSATWGVWFVCPQIWTHEVELRMCYISMPLQDYPLRKVEMSSLNLQAVLQWLQGVGKVLSDHTSLAS